MHFKPIFFVLFAAVLLANQSEAHLKLKLLKAKLLAAKAPHVAAHLAVGAEVKADTVDAVVKTVGAVKAVKKATFSVLTAPFKVVGKTIALKVGAIKAAKALKVAKVATVVDTLKKHPIIIPVPVPVKVPFPVFNKDHLKTGAIAGAASGLIGSAFTPVQGLISGAQNLIQSAGSRFPSLLPTTNSGVTVSQPQPEAVYRFIPSAPAISQYSTVHYSSSNNNVEEGNAQSVGFKTYGPPKQ